MERSSKIKRLSGNSNNYLAKKRNRDGLERNILIRKFINRKLEGEYEITLNIFRKMFAFNWDDEKIVKHKINQNLLKNITTKSKKEIPQFLEKIIELFGGNLNVYKKHSPIRAKAKFLNDIRDLNFLLNKKSDLELDNKINTNNVLDIEPQSFLDSLNEKIPDECLVETDTKEFIQNNLTQKDFTNFTTKSSTIDELIEELNLKQKLLDKKNLNLTNKLSTRFNSEEAKTYHKEILNNNLHDPYLLQDMEYTCRYKDEYLNSIKTKHNEYKKSLQKKLPYMNFKDAFNQHEDQTICQVCNTEDYEDKDLIVYCARCELTVHQTCYGIIDLPIEDWLCEPCREFSIEKVYGLECILCPVKGGAMKQTQLSRSTSAYKYINKLRSNNYGKIKQKVNTVDLLSPSSISNCKMNLEGIPTNNTVLAEHLETPIKFGKMLNSTAISAAITNSVITNTTNSSENEDALSMSIASSAINTMYKTNIPQFTVVKEPIISNTEFAWIHVACALWIPDVEIGNFEKKEEIKNFERIPKERFKEKCSICKLKNYGPTKKCHDTNCVVKFHVECARINSCCMEVADVNGVLEYQIFCITHRPNKLLKTIETRRNKIKEDVKSFSEIILKNLNSFEKEYKYSLLKYERKKISLKTNKAKKINTKENLSSKHSEIKKDPEEKIILSLKEKHSFISQIKYVCKLYSNHNLITLRKIKKESLNRKNSETENLYSLDFNSFKNKIKFADLKKLKNFPWSLIRIKNFNLHQVKKLFHIMIPDESTYNKKILKRKLKHKEKKIFHNKDKDKVELKNNTYVNIIFENGNEPAKIENYEIDENLYCYCQKICCDGDIMINCQFENDCKGAFNGWFHKKCVADLKRKSRKSINDSNFKFTCKECKEFNENNNPCAIIETKLDTIPENKFEVDKMIPDLCSE